jgi:hypothetical protein
MDSNPDSTVGMTILFQITYNSGSYHEMSMVTRVMTPGGLVNAYECFGGTYYLHLLSSALMIDLI